MRLLILLLFLLIHSTITVFAQMPLLDVADLTIKIAPKSEEVLYYGFAKGDKIIFSVWEEDNKELTQVSIEEFPNQVRFSDYKTTSVKEKTITVNRKSVYVFKFVNNQVLKGRVCHIKIQRVPATDTTLDFNTQVQWITTYDTTYQIGNRNVLMGYDTLMTKEESWEFKKSAQEEVVVFDKSQKVAAKANISGANNRICLRIEFPPNINSKANSNEMQGWAYWIGVGEEAGIAWAENVQTVAGFAQGVIAMYSPLGGLVAGLVSGLAVPKTGDDIYYCIADATQADLFLTKKNFVPLDWGKGKGGYGKFNHKQPMPYYICLENDNYLHSVEVTVKVAAMVEVKQYTNKEKTKQTVNPRMQKTSVEEPIITPITIPVTWE